jgi:hypothetical protein
MREFKHFAKALLLGLGVIMTSSVKWQIAVYLPTPIFPFVPSVHCGHLLH